MTESNVRAPYRRIGQARSQTSAGTEGELEAVVIGGGIAGLAAAWELRDMRVRLLEASPRVGGRLMSTPRGRYWLNFGGHVLKGEDSATGRLLNSVGVAAADVPGVLTGIAFDDTLIAGRRVETLPVRLPLTLSERLALARAGAKLRVAVAQYTRVAASRSREFDTTHRRRVLGFRDDRTFAEFIGPLPPRVDAVFRATIRRSSGEPEQVSAGYGIGYFQLVWDRDAGLTRNILGGSSAVADGISTALGERIDTECMVEEVASEPDRVVVRFLKNGRSHELTARFAVLATPAHVTSAIVRELPGQTAHALRQITYGPYVVGALLTNETQPMPYDHIYAMATPGKAFNMIFNTANVLRGGVREAGGTLMVYAGAELARRLDGVEDARVAQLFAEDLLDVFPALRGRIAEVQIKRWPHGLPYPQPGRHRLQAGLERPLQNVFLAGDYLGTTYVETAVHTGVAAAYSIRSRMRQGHVDPTRRCR